jgi:hypothetical protein
MSIPVVPPPSDFPEKRSPNVDAALRQNLIDALKDSGIAEPEEAADQLIAQAQKTGHDMRELHPRDDG